MHCHAGYGGAVTSTAGTSCPDTFWALGYLVGKVCAESGSVTERAESTRDNNVLQRLARPWIVRRVRRYRLGERTGRGGL